MAFSILVELNKKNTDWKSISKAILEAANDVLEFFPVPNFPKTGKDYIGISVPNRDFTEKDLESIRACIKQLLQDEHKVVELYNSSQFTMETVDMVTEKFFKPRKK